MTARIESVAIETLLGHQTVRSHSDGDIQRLVGVVGEFGALRLPVWNAAQKALIDGAGLVEAAYADGNGSLICIVVDFDEEQHLLAQLAMSASYGKRDAEATAEALHKLHSLDADLDLCGLKPWEIERILGEPKEREPLRCPKCGEEIARKRPSETGT